jgi:hypothetical protein
MSTIDQLQLGDFLDSTVSCLRCAMPCVVAETSNPEARILRAATTPHGVCPACHVTAFLQDPMYPFREFIERDNFAQLRDPRIQDEFTKLAIAGNADVPTAQIDWERVIQNWDLPHPSGTYGKGKRARRP